MYKMNESVRKELEMMLAHFPDLTDCKNAVQEAFELMWDCYCKKGLIMTCGNGGSAADAEHIVGELMKGFKLKRCLTKEQIQKLNQYFPEDAPYLSAHLQQAIPAISLVSQTSLSTAFVNDVHADMVFAQQVLAYGKEGDVLIAISTSGNSKNVVNACKVAKSLSVRTIGLTGNHGGILREICDVLINVPAHEVFRIQEYHLPVYHTLCAMMEKAAFRD